MTVNDVTMLFYLLWAFLTFCMLWILCLGPTRIIKVLCRRLQPRIFKSCVILNPFWYYNKWKLFYSHLPQNLPLLDFFVNTPTNLKSWITLLYTVLFIPVAIMPIYFPFLGLIFSLLFDSGTKGCSFQNELIVISLTLLYYRYITKMMMMFWIKICQQGFPKDALSSSQSPEEERTSTKGE